MYKKQLNGKTKDLAKDAAGYLENQSSYDKAILKVALVRIQKELKPYWGMIELFHKSDDISIKESTHDYGNLILVTHVFSSNDILRFLNSIAENQRFNLPDGTTLTFEDHAESLFLYSNDDYGIAQKHSWPCNNLILRFPQVQVDQYAKLARRGLPLYPDPYIAMTDFLKLGYRLSASDSSRALVIKMPDFRARITKMVITGNKMKITVENKDISSQALTAKIYTETESLSYKSEDLKFHESQTIICEADFEPESINLCILDESDDIVDSRDINLRWFRYSPDVKIETPSLHVKELLLRGENENVEFKREISKNKNEFLETIVAFANAGGGMILLGVDDDGVIYGCSEDAKELNDSVRDSISSRIEPRGVKLEFQSIEMDGNGLGDDKKTIVLVRILEGENKPYFLRDKGFLLRRGSTDRLMTRNELDEIYQKRNVSNTIGQSFPSI